LNYNSTTHLTKYAKSDNAKYDKPNMSVVER